LLAPVAGLRTTENSLSDVIGRVATPCADEDTDCYLVDDGAVIVYTDSGDIEVRNSRTSESNEKYKQLEMWANAQRDGRPAAHR